MVVLEVVGIMTRSAVLSGCYSSRRAMPIATLALLALVRPDTEGATVAKPYALTQ